MFDRNLFMLGVLACHRSSMCSVFGALCFVHICTDLKKKNFLNPYNPKRHFGVVCLCSVLRICEQKVFTCDVGERTSP